MSTYAEQNPNRVVYEPPEPHRCVTEGPFQPDMRVGSIIRCDCGRYWHRTWTDWGIGWTPVRWWNFDARRRIRESKGAQR